MPILRRSVKGARSSSVHMMPETDGLSKLPDQPINVQPSRSEVGKKVNTMKERNKVVSPTSNPASAPPHLQRTAHPVVGRKRSFQQGGSMSLEEFKSIQKKMHPESTIGVMDVLNAPQKTAMYGVTTATRGIGNGVYDTPGNIMNKDWSSYNNKVTRGIADISLDPLNALPMATFNKTMSGMRASILPFIKNISQRSGKVYNAANTAVDVMNLGDNALNLYK